MTPMPRSRSTLGTQLGLALVAAATTWAALLSWLDFAVHPHLYLVPLAGLGVLVAVIGAVARWWRVPGPLVVVAQVVVSGLVTSQILCGSPIPIGASWHRLDTAFHGAITSANTYAPPVPANVPGIHPLLIVGGLACLIVVDALACTLRRVPLAGLPLLAAYSVPVSLLGHGLSWWVFALMAVGFLSMLFLHEVEHVGRWGRRLDDDAAQTGSAGPARRSRTSRLSAVAVGSTVTVLALVVPVFVPTLHVHALDFGVGDNGDGNISITNPMVSLQRDLNQTIDTTLLVVHTNDPDPSYLRIAVLTEFEDDQWRAGERDVPRDNQASGQLPPLDGVNTGLRRQYYNYDVTATPGFDSTWLPTTQDVSEVDVNGDWRYDPEEMDFLAAGDNANLSGTSYHFTGVKLDLNADNLAAAGPAGALVADKFTDLPSDLSSKVRNLALGITRNAPSRFQKAIALQEWFRKTGHFTYDTSTDLGDGRDDLMKFLSKGPGGRRGYCQQFAASMAVMARTLGIPARVAVGFLHPTQTNVPDTWVYSSKDLHAWPELYFPGSGWVRFEPTPTRAGSVPSYTTEHISVTDPTLPSDSLSAPSARPTAKDLGDDPLKAKRQQAHQGGTGSSFPVRRVVAGGGLLLLILLVGFGPRWVRSRRRTQRSASGPEDAWAELRDTVIDVALTWPRDRSPRQTRDVLVRWFGAPIDEYTPEVPRRGPDTNPDAVLALDRIVLALERLRYARADGTAPGTWRAEIQTCEEALLGGTPRRQRFLARWWPRSVFARTVPIRVRTSADAAPEAAAVGRVVDHVG